MVAIGIRVPGSQPESNGRIVRGGPMAQETAERQGTPALRLVRPVVLIGLMGAGKSSVGAKLAEVLGAGFCDSDAEIEKAANLSVPEIFERYGEAHFRDGERRVIARLLGGKPLVLATGGGAFMDAETRALIAERAVSVWLKADLELLVQRTAGRGHRPLLNRGDPRETLAGLIAVRYPVYGQADVHVDSRPGQAHERMALRIIAGLKKHGDRTGRGAFEQGAK
jgi:shikimate kinase